MVHGELHELHLALRGLHLPLHKRCRRLQTSSRRLGFRPECRFRELHPAHRVGTDAVRTKRCQPPYIPGLPLSCRTPYRPLPLRTLLRHERTLEPNAFEQTAPLQIEETHACLAAQACSKVFEHSSFSKSLTP